jgi:DNA-binding transcriptional MerR regulator
LNASEAQEIDHAPAPHDPAVLTTSHRLFLTSLCHSLLITDIPYTTALRNLLHNIDALVAIVTRLQSIQESLDLEEDEGVIDPMSDFAKQEEEVKRELGRARKRIDAKLKEVVGRLRTIDQQGETLELEDDLAESGNGGFIPWRVAGIERLLMRLEGERRVGQDGDGDDDEY